MVIAGISFRPALDANEVMRLLQKGNKRRRTEATEANATSSRSHAVLQIYVERKSLEMSKANQIRFGKLNLIDLAGSEKGSVANTRGKLREGGNINKSLLALANCINALVDKS